MTFLLYMLINAGSYWFLSSELFRYFDWRDLEVFRCHTIDVWYDWTWNFAMIHNVLTTETFTPDLIG